jgi:hypothetical protein
MKALSIRQPWAWAILHAGKDVENRDWQRSNPGLRFRGDFLIHASGGMTKDEYGDFLDTAHHISAHHPFRLGLALPTFSELPRGGIVGRARVVDVRREHDSPWFVGPVGLVVADARPLPFVPFKGSLGFFDVPDELVRFAA